MISHIFSDISSISANDVHRMHLLQLVAFSFSQSSVYALVLGGYAQSPHQFQHLLLGLTH
jgi:hypothetical protein